MCSLSYVQIINYFQRTYASQGFWKYIFNLYFKQKEQTNKRVAKCERQVYKVNHV